MNMQIELYIDGKKKVFTTPFVPMLAKRKYLEIMAKIEDRGEKVPLYKEQLEYDIEMFSILSDIVFNRQFTVEQLYAGAEEEYVHKKLREAIFGIPSEDDKGNEQGK
jgi:hypothetical protein